jgi:radical SAM superfamily enzyme YgiQ (UPF0313 family)
MADKLLEFEPGVVGLTSLGCNFICTVKVAGCLKASCPDLPILLGGPHATVLDRPIMERFAQFDLIVRNEAEIKLNPVLESLSRRTFDHIPGITFRRGGEIISNPGDPVVTDLDALPWPAYDRYPVRELGLTSLRVDAGRGCPFHCTFCSTATFFGRKYRLRSAQNLRGHLDRLHAEYGISDFSLMHDLFTVRRKKVLEFCDAVAGSGYTWKCSARMDCVDDALLEAMHHSGCREIYYGIEAGTERMQEISQKKLNLALFQPTLDVTQRLGMPATVSFITGFPLEEQEDQDGTLDLMGSCFYRNSTPLNVQLHLLMPEPGTQLVAESAASLRYDGYVADFNFPALGDDDSHIMSSNPDIFMNHHYFETVMPRQRHIFVTSLYQYLFSLGPAVLSDLLDRYEGRLSVLYAALYRKLGLIPPPFDGDFIRSFLEMDLGPDHYLVSLVRYMLAASRLARRIPGRETAALVDSSHSETPAAVDRCVLSPKAAVLTDIHDCPELLQLLSRRRNGEDVAVPGDLGSQRRSYLLFHEDPESELVRNFELDELSAGILQSFLTPQPLDRLFAEFVSSGIDREEFDGFVAQAVDKGVLLRCQCKESAVLGEFTGRLTESFGVPNSLGAASPHV